MIVSKQVEKAVNEEAEKLLAERHAVFLCLFLGRWHRDDDVAEEPGLEQRGGVIEGEGEHIGGLILTPMLPVHPPHLGVVSKDHA